MLRPDKALRTFPLMFGGAVHLGRFRFPPKGLRVGTEPLGARILGLDHIPDEWFIITSQRSQARVISELEKGFIPDWLRADCFEYLYNKLIQEGK